MGILERRSMLKLVEQTLPARSAEIVEICGQAISYELDQSSFDLNGTAEPIDFVDNLSCHRLNMALRSICTDELGKDAVRKGLKCVRLINVTDGKYSVELVDAVLTLKSDYAQRAFPSDQEIYELLCRRL